MRHDSAMTRQRAPDPGRRPPASSAEPAGPITALGAGVPVVLLLDALDGWRSTRSKADLDRVRSSLGEVLRASGAAGAYLDLNAPPLPAMRVGVGTLLRRPSVAQIAAGGLQASEVRTDAGRQPAGRLWLDAEVGGSADRPLDAGRVIRLALDAAWSRETVHQTVERLQALDAATRAIAGVLAHERVLQLICDRVRELIGAEYAALGIADSEGLLERFVTSGLSRLDRERIGPLPRGHGLLGLIIREGRSFRIPDLVSDSRRYGFPPNHPAMHSFLGVPITVKSRPIGDLYLTNKRGALEFSAADQELVEMFAVHAGIAIENARLHEQVQRLAVVAERERIGQDLHDGIIQRIYAVALSLEDVPELMVDEAVEANARIERAIEGLNQTIRDIRTFIFGLQPDALGELGLVGGLSGLLDEFRLNTMIDTELQAVETADLAFGAEPTQQILHIVREALSNVARHSGATRVGLVVRVDESGSVVFEIGDNGRGFDRTIDHGPGHQGLVNMRARALGLGGSLEAHSEPDAGTRIIVRVPRPSGD